MAIFNSYVSLPEGTINQGSTHFPVDPVAPKLQPFST